MVPRGMVNQFPHSFLLLMEVQTPFEEKNAPPRFDWGTPERKPRHWKLDRKISRIPRVVVEALIIFHSP